MSDMNVVPGAMNPYEAPKVSLEDQKSARGFWTGRVLMDMIGGVFWVAFGSFWLVLGAFAFWHGGREGGQGIIPGFGTLALGLFLLSRVDKARRRGRLPTDESLSGSLCRPTYVRDIALNEMTWPEPMPMNPYEAPNGSVEGRSSPRSWTSRDTQDVIGGAFWILVGAFMVFAVWGVPKRVSGPYDPPNWLASFIMGIPFFLGGGFLLQRAIRRTPTREKTSLN